MPVYTLVITRADGSQATTMSDFPDDQTAIADTGVFVSADHPTAALARGAGEGLEFLCAWDWDASGSTWTAAD